jgi:ABC-type transport system involved in multi-copper enzyme maturation permease subunit
MLGNLIQIEQTKLFKRLIFWIEMGLLCGLFLLYYVGGVVASSKPGVPISTSTSPSLISIVTWPRSLIDILTLISGNNLGGIVLMILIAVVVAQEYQWNTISLWLSRGTPRPLLLAARFGALFLAALLMIVIPLLIGGAVTAILTMLIHGKLDLSVVNFGQLMLGVVRVLLTALPYLTFTFMMATLTRSVAGGMGAGIGFLFVTEGVLPLLMLSVGADKAVLYLPGMLAKSLLQLNAAIANTALGAFPTLDAGKISTLAEPTVAAAGLVLYAVIFLGIAFYRFQRQDLSA